MLLLLSRHLDLDGWIDLGSLSEMAKCVCANEFGESPLKNRTQIDWSICPTFSVKSKSLLTNCFQFNTFANRGRSAKSIKWDWISQERPECTWRVNIWLLKCSMLCFRLSTECQQNYWAAVLISMHHITSKRRRLVDNTKYSILIS